MYRILLTILFFTSSTQINAQELLDYPEEHLHSYNIEEKIFDEIEGLSFNQEICKQYEDLNLSSIDCRMLVRHLKRDTKSCLLNTYNIESQIYKGKTTQKMIKGRIRYVGVWPAKYQYKMTRENGKIIVSTNLSFKNIKKLSSYTIEKMEKKVKYAQDYWNKYVPSNLNVEFKFSLLKNKKIAYFTPKLKDKYTRGPYYKNWSSKWNTFTIAHEMGHILGLDDEYKNTITGGNSKSCNPRSIMCMSKHNAPIPEYIYYLILRRFSCN